MGSSLATEQKNGIVIATLNRPEKMNALNKEIYEEINHLIDRIEADRAVRALVITGAGQKAFCVGADLKERLGMNEKDTLNRLEFVRGVFPRLEALRVPVIAAINGLALGGGLELALACDLRVAAESAIVGLPEVDLAIIPGSGGTQRLSRLIGLGRALEMILLAKRIKADEAFSLGVVNAVTPNDRCLSQALEWAEKLLKAGPLAIEAAKHAVRKGIEKDLEEGLVVETEAYKKTLYSQDRLEGLKAFAEKRTPQYQGH